MLQRGEVLNSMGGPGGTTDEVGEVVSHKREV